MVHSSEKTDALVSWASTAPPDSSPKRGWGKVAGLLFVAVACLLFAYMNVLSDVVRLACDRWTGNEKK